MNPVRLITLDPGHFHAALVQKEMYPGVSPTVHVFAPLGPDLIAHLNRIAAFNARTEGPTDWRLEVHAGSNFFHDFLRDRPGDVVMIAGRNRDKIHYIEAAVDAGMHVLADKPWIIVPEDLPWLETVLARAEKRRLVAYDIMTERYEVTSILQRGLVQDAGVFGDVVPGSEAEPAVEMASVHYLMKLVAGQPLRRPPWFFDVWQQGEGLADVGTHLVDLVPWVLFPKQALDHRSDVAILSAKRWPTVLSRADFQRVTGEADFPDFLRGELKDGQLPYFCNTLVNYTLRGVHVKLDIRWDFEAAAGAGDTHFAVFRGSRSRVEIRQGPEQRYRPELYVVPNSSAERAAVGAALRPRVETLQRAYAGVAVEEEGEEFRVTIPDQHRVGHEAHFAEVTRQFLAYVRDPKWLPAWERPNVLAKYAVTTLGVQKSREAAG